MFKRASHWGITELKSDLLVNWLSTTTDDNRQDEDVNKAIKIILKGVFLDNYGKFDTVEKGLAKDMFDLPCPLNQIESFLREKLGSSYDKKVERALDKFKRD